MKRAKQKTVWQSAMFMASVVLCFGIVMFYEYRLTSQAMWEAIEAHLMRSAELAARVVEDGIGDDVYFAQTLVHLPAFIDKVQSRDEEGVRGMLRGYVHEHPMIVRAFVHTPEGVLWSDYPEAPESLGKDFSYRDWYQGLSRTWEPYTSIFYRRHASPQTIVISTAVPIRDSEDRVIGGLVHQYTQAKINEWLQNLPRDEEVSIVLLDRDNMRGIEKNGGDIDIVSAPDEYIQRAGDRAGKKPVLSRYRSPETGEMVLSATVPIEIGQNPWRVVVEQSLAVAAAPVERLRIRIMGIVIGFGLLASTIVFLILQREKRQAEWAAALAAANKELQAFSYSVSHDLRAPLRAIDGFSQALEEDAASKLDEDERRYVDRIRKGTQRMGELIDEMLRLSRITMQDIERQPLKISAMAHELIEELKEAEPERDVEAYIEPDLSMKADKELTTIALRNLLGNAWKFTRGTDRKARIEVGEAVRAGQKWIYVRDNGVGFDMKYANKLFTAFQRLHSESEFEGIGIGLAIVSRIVLKHGGGAEVEAENGEGATFYIRLEP